MKELPKCFYAVFVQIAPLGEEHVLLSLYMPPVVNGNAFVFTFEDEVDGPAEVADDEEFVVDDPGLGSVAKLEGGLAIRLPHIHYCQTISAAFLGAEPVKEGIKACFRAIGSAEPDRPASEQIADYDPVFVSLARRRFRRCR